MTRKLNVESLKILRNRKQWSQEELALAAGLGLRTVQRAEKEATVSTNTLKSLCAALSVAPEELLAADAERYFNIQLGYTILTVLGAMLILLVMALAADAVNAMSFFIAFAGLIIVTILFATLAIKVEPSALRWHMGIGVIHGRIPLDSIESHRVVRNKAWWGFGIRLIPGGYLYSVSGLGAVEIRLKNQRIVRLGSDEPEALNAALTHFRGLPTMHTSNNSKI